MNYYYRRLSLSLFVSIHFFLHLEPNALLNVTVEGSVGTAIQNAAKRGLDQTVMLLLSRGGNQPFLRFTKFSCNEGNSYFMNYAAQSFKLYDSRTRLLVRFTSFVQRTPFWATCSVRTRSAVLEKEVTRPSSAP